MFSTLLLDRESKSIATLQEHLNSYCPKIDIKGVASCKDKASSMIQELRPEIVFIDMDLALNAEATIFKQNFKDFEAVIMCPISDLVPNLSTSRASGFLTKPYQVGELIISVRNIQQKIELKQIQLECKNLLSQLTHHIPPNNLISIPTIDGMEFLKIDEIIRCEGLQRHTRIITIEKTDIISSYNIGVFCKLFEGHGFFATHKSHLVNLRHIKRYKMEGSLFMKDNSIVPVSRRRKSDFFKQIKHV